VSWLDDQTKRLSTRFPAGAQKWGAARKAVNIFMRTAVYNVYTSPLAEAYQLAPFLPFLEVPLDKDVAIALRATPEGADLPVWISIVSLTPKRSEMYQCVASCVARRMNVHRADLDAYYWGVRAR
jgi:hypothetical protein